MLKRFFLGIVLGMALFGGGIFAFDVPQFDGYVTDKVGILSEVQREELNQYSAELDRKTGAQVATLIVNDLGDMPVQMAAHEVFSKWKIGQKGKDNGVLFLVAIAQKKIFIEVGYGLEGFLPDGRVGRVRDEVIFPSFRQRHLDQGVIAGHRTLVEILAKELPVEGHRREGTWKKTDRSLVWVVLGVVLVMWFLARRKMNSGTDWGLWAFIMMLLSMGGGGRGGFWGGRNDSSGGFDGFGGGDSGGGGSGGSW